MESVTHYMRPQVVTWAKQDPIHIRKETLVALVISKQPFRGTILKIEHLIDYADIGKFPQSLYKKRQKFQQIHRNT